MALPIPVTYADAHTAEQAFRESLPEGMTTNEWRKHTEAQFALIRLWLAYPDVTHYLRKSERGRV